MRIGSAPLAIHAHEQVFAAFERRLWFWEACVRATEMVTRRELTHDAFIESILVFSCCEESVTHAMPLEGPTTRTRIALRYVVDLLTAHYATILIPTEGGYPKKTL